MSVSRWAASLFVAWYLIAMVAAAVPAQRAVPPAQPIVHAPYNAIAAAIGPPLDASARAVHRLARWASSVVEWARPVTGDLLVQAGMAQRWDMFANPQRSAQYLRVKWYVAGGTAAQAGRPTWAATALIMPASREDRVRGIRSFRNFSMDRPADSAIDRFHPSGDPTDSASLLAFASALRPAVEYHTHEFERAYLQAGERIVRIEVWHGTADLGPPDDAQDLGDRSALRRNVLRNYRGGPIVESVITRSYPPYYASQRESDILWILEYIDSR